MATFFDCLPPLPPSPSIMGSETLNLGWNPDDDRSWVSSSPCFYSPPPPPSSSSPWFYSSPSPSSSWTNNGVAQPSSSDNRKDEEEEKKKKKPRLSWSVELHKRFLLAVDACGGPQTAVPSHILKVMNVQGLSRHNVASHLQKFRAQLKKMNEGLPVPVHESVSDLCYFCPSNPKIPNFLEPCPPLGFPMSPLLSSIQYITQSSQQIDDNIHGEERMLAAIKGNIKSPQQVDIDGEESMLAALQDNYIWSQQIDLLGKPMLAAIKDNTQSPQQIEDNIQSSQQIDIHGEEPMLAALQDNYIWSQQIDLLGQPMLGAIQPTKIQQSQQQLDILGESMREAIQHNIQVDTCRQLESGNNSTHHSTADTHPRQLGSGINSTYHSSAGTHPRQLENKRTRVDAVGGISDVPQLKTKKARFSWTPSKHQKFVAAVESLGHERAVPKKIMEFMGVGDLNRHIIASHLQGGDEIFRFNGFKELERFLFEDEIHDEF